MHSDASLNYLPRRPNGQVGNHAHLCVCAFIKLHITTQSGPAILVILCVCVCESVCMCLCVCVYSFYATCIDHPKGDQ